MGLGEVGLAEVGQWFIQIQFLSHIPITTKNACKQIMGENKDDKVQRHLVPSDCCDG